MAKKVQKLLTVKKNQMSLTKKNKSFDKKNFDKKLVGDKKVQTNYHL